VYFVFIDSQSASYILSRQKQLRPSLIELLETDVLGVLPEALPAEVQVVLSDEAVAVGAGAAAPGALPVLPGPGVPDVFVTHIGCG